jgi:hypothetical protein
MDVSATSNVTSHVEHIPIADAIRLWRHLFGDRPDLIAVFTGFRPERLGGKLDEHTTATRYYEPGELDQAVAWSSQQGSIHRDVYFCAHQLTARRRVKENAASVGALWCETDGADLNASPIKPTAVVESSPGHFHCYAKLEHPIAPSKAEELNKRWALSFGADTSGFDLTQLLRVPGTRNHKYPDAPVVTLRYVDDDTVFKPDELEHVLPALPKSARPEPTGFAEALSEDDFELIATLGQKSPLFGRLYAGDTTDYEDDGKVDYSDADWACAQDLLRATAGDQERVYRLMCQSSLARPRWNERRGDTDYLAYTIARAAANPSIPMTSWPPHVASAPGPANGQCSPHCHPHLNRIAQLERELTEIHRREARRAALVRNKSLSAAAKVVATAILNEQASRESRGLYGPIPIIIDAEPPPERANWPNSTLTGMTGLSPGVARRAMKHLTGPGGLWQEQVEPRVAKDGKRYGSRLFLKPTAAADELWNQVPSIQPAGPEPKAPTSQPRVPTCRRHPMAPVDRTTRHRCTLCGRDTTRVVRQRFDPVEFVRPITDPNVTGEAVPQPALQFDNPAITTSPVASVDGLEGSQNATPVLIEEQLAGLNRLYERGSRVHQGGRCDRRSRGD